MVSIPPLLNLADEDEYRKHFINTLCDQRIICHDGIRAFFERNTFDHAFFQSSNRDGNKDQFSLERAQRMDWITPTLQHPRTRRYRGWDGRLNTFSNDRRVEILFQTFVVIIKVIEKNDGTFKGRFVTCYNAKHDMGKIIQGGFW